MLQAGGLIVRRAGDANEFLLVTSKKDPSVWVLQLPSMKLRFSGSSSVWRLARSSERQLEVQALDALQVANHLEEIARLGIALRT